MLPLLHTHLKQNKTTIGNNTIQGWKKKKKLLLLRSKLTESEPYRMIPTMAPTLVAETSEKGGRKQASYFSVGTNVKTDNNFPRRGE